MKYLTGALTVAALFLVASWGIALAGDDHSKEAEERDDSLKRAVAVIHPTKDNSARGVVHFHRSAPGQVTLSAHIEGLEPEQKHGFHIHEYGDCSAEDGTSAGDHYNPEGHPHGLQEEDERHAGDLGNIVADEQGKGTLILTVDNISIAGESNPIIGRGLIVHRDPDDGSQPVGDAGPRIGCGVIGVASGEG